MRHPYSNLARKAWATRVLLASVILGLDVGRVAVAEEASPDLKAITAALTQWSESVANVRFGWTVTFDPNSELAKDNKLQGVVRRAEVEWIWTDTGRLHHHRTVFWDDQPKMRSFQGADGQRVFSANYRMGKSEFTEPKGVTIALGTPSAPGDVEPLFGLWYGRQHKWLAGMLAAGKARLDGFGDHKGNRYPRLRVETSETTTLVLLLDPAHGFLPRLTETEHLIDGETKRGFPNEVDEFREIEPGVWFPWSGRFDQFIDVNSWKMRSIEINQPLAASLFKPPIADGTDVTDLVAKRRYFHGRRPPDAGSEPDIVDEARRNLEAAGPPPAAQPDGGGFSLSKSLLAVSVVVLLIGLWFRFVR